MVQDIRAHAEQVYEQIGRCSLDERVIEVMARVPRHEFVPIELVPYAYVDQPLPIGFDKTISQPFIVALMTHLLDVRPTDRVLEVGTGLGYHTALLAELAHEVCSIEIVEELATQAAKRLATFKYANIRLRQGNGEYGWPEHGPYDRILVCAASELMPPMLLGQLKPGGRMVVPTGMPDQQILTLVVRGEDGKLAIRDILPVRFALLETAN